MSLSTILTFFQVSGQVVAEVLCCRHISEELIISIVVVIHGYFMETFAKSFKNYFPIFVDERQDFFSWKKKVFINYT